MILSGILNSCYPHITTSQSKEKEGQDDSRNSIWWCHASYFSPSLSGICQPCVNDIIPLSQFYTASNQHIPLGNDLMMHKNMAEDVFVAMNTLGDSKHHDDTSEEFDTVKAFWCNSVGIMGQNASETVGESSMMPTEIFVAPPWLDEAQLALDNLKNYFAHHELPMQSMVDTRIPDWICIFELSLREWNRPCGHLLILSLQSITNGQLPHYTWQIISKKKNLTMHESSEKQFVHS